VNWALDDHLFLLAEALVVVEEGGEAYKPVQPLGVLSSFCFPECQYPIKPNPVWLTYEVYHG